MSWSNSSMSNVLSSVTLEARTLDHPGPPLPEGWDGERETRSKCSARAVPQ
jgi:hypothetical protein